MALGTRLPTISGAKLRLRHTLKPNEGALIRSPRPEVIDALVKPDLQQLARTHAEDFRMALPFPHLVLDDVFDADRLAAVAAAFPGVSDPRWKRYEGEHERGKQEIDDPATWPTEAADLLDVLCSRTWLSFLEQLTGQDRLLAAHEGAGMHLSGPGARLDVHLDFNRNPSGRLERRLNTIVFLNSDWSAADGGNLQLWDRGHPVTQIVPEFGRVVIFEASDRSFHGHPEPVVERIDERTGEPRARKSIALFYYGRAAAQSPAKRSTVWWDETDQATTAG